jgi:hypothetical protein
MFAVIFVSPDPVATIRPDGLTVATFAFAVVNVARLAKSSTTRPDSS